jgi:hypothetical protein
LILCIGGLSGRYPTGQGIIPFEARWSPRKWTRVLEPVQFGLVLPHRRTPARPNPSYRTRRRCRRHGPPPCRLLAARCCRSSTMGLPQWGKDAHPPHFSLGLVSPQSRGLAGALEPPPAAARPLRPNWPPLFPPKRFPMRSATFSA